MVLLFVAGFSLVSAFSTLNSLVQENAPADLKGRVLSIYGFAFRGGMPLGSLIAGVLVRSLGVPVVLGAFSAALVVLCAVLYAPERAPALRLDPRGKRGVSWLRRRGLCCPYANGPDQAAQRQPQAAHDRPCPPSRDLHRLSHLRPPAQHPVGHAQHRLRLRRAPRAHAVVREASLKADAPRGSCASTTLSCPRCSCWSRATCCCTIRRACWPGACSTTSAGSRRLPWLALALAPPRRRLDRDPIALAAGRAGRAPGRRYLAAGLVRASRRGCAARPGRRRRCCWSCCPRWPSWRWAPPPAGPTGRTAASSSCPSPSTRSWRGRAPTAPTTPTASWASRRASPTSGTTTAATRSSTITPTCPARTC